MKKILLLCLLAIVAAACGNGAQTPVQEASKEIYEVRLYTIESAEKAASFDAFAQSQLVPAYSRMGIKTGAWREYEKDSVYTRYLVLIYNNIDQFQQSKTDLWADSVFVQESAAWFKKNLDDPAYKRCETYLCEAFDGQPFAATPESPRGFYEMRIYNSPDEEALERKVRMFNSGEMDIFAAAGVNCLFFGQAMAGPETPVLIYMTWYNNIDEREVNWEKFRTSDAWTQMKADPQYDRATSTTRNVYLSPLPYSQF